MLAANPVTDLLCLALTVYWIVMLVVIIASFFPLSPGSPAAPFFNFLHSFTEPVLRPIRRVMPPLGGFDLSPMVVFVGLLLLRSIIGCGGGVL